MTFQHNGMDAGILAGSARYWCQGCANYKILWRAPVSYRSVALLQSRRTAGYRASAHASNPALETPHKTCANSKQDRTRREPLQKKE